MRSKDQIVSLAKVTVSKDKMYGLDPGIALCSTRLYGEISTFFHIWFSQNQIFQYSLTFPQSN